MSGSFFTVGVDRWKSQLPTNKELLVPPVLFVIFFHLTASNTLYSSVRYYCGAI